VLVRARAILARPYAWTKGRAFTRQGRAPGGFAYCAIGAISQAQETGGTYAAKMALNEQLVVSGLGQGGGAVIGFNDAPTTRKRDVLELFDRAIRATEGER
jgi:hypothetical protein